MLTAMNTPIPRPEHPRPQCVRERWLNLNGPWQFEIDQGDTGLERQLFCGAGSLGASDRANYPAFMRFGFRSSLRAGYTVHNLGFRCAKNP